MFGFGKKKPKTVLDQFIFAVYGNPPPAKRANVKQAIALACDDLLLGLIDREAVRKHTLDLAATPIPYSTHDLAVSAALNFFKDPQYIPYLGTAQLAARMQAMLWTKHASAVQKLNEMHSGYFSLAGISLPAMRPPFTFPHYVRHYLDNTCSYGEPISRRIHL